jgi:hypothetical protein
MTDTDKPKANIRRDTHLNEAVKEFHDRALFTLPDSVVDVMRKRADLMVGQSEWSFHQNMSPTSRKLSWEKMARTVVIEQQMGMLSA